MTAKEPEDHPEMKGKIIFQSNLFWGCSMIRFSGVYGIVFIIYGWDHLETLTLLTFIVR